MLQAVAVSIVAAPGSDTPTDKRPEVPHGSLLVPSPRAAPLRSLCHSKAPPHFAQSAHLLPQPLQSFCLIDAERSAFCAPLVGDPIADPHRAQSLPVGAPLPCGFSASRHSPALRLAVCCGLFFYPSFSPKIIILRTNRWIHTGVQLKRRQGRVLSDPT